VEQFHFRNQKNDASKYTLRAVQKPENEAIREIQLHHTPLRGNTRQTLRGRSHKSNQAETRYQAHKINGTNNGHAQTLEISKTALHRR
jgi:hypothetical protein